MGNITIYILKMLLLVFHLPVHFLVHKSHASVIMIFKGLQTSTVAE